MTGYFLKTMALFVVALSLCACSGRKDAAQEPLPGGSTPPAVVPPANTAATMKEQTVCVEAPCGSFKLKINADMTGTVSPIPGSGEWAATLSEDGDHLYAEVSPPASASNLKSLKFSTVLDDQKNITFVGIVVAGGIYNPATIIRCP